MGYEIGPKLRKYREAQNLSQKEFAKLIGVSNSRVSNWELGINRPDVDFLSIICEVLKVSPSELLDIKFSPNLENSSCQSSYEKKQREFFDVFDELPPALQDYLIKTAKDLLKAQQKLLNSDNEEKE